MGCGTIAAIPFSDARDRLCLFRSLHRLNRSIPADGTGTALAIQVEAAEAGYDRREFRQAALFRPVDVPVPLGNPAHGSCA